jgi:arginyl-tRNA synthetase
MNLETIIEACVIKSVKDLYGQDIDNKLVQLQATRKEFDGDITLVVFPFLKISKKNPEATANELGAYIKENLSEVSDFNVIKGFLNLSISGDIWIEALNKACGTENFGYTPVTENSPVVMVEFSSPNTNKPQHLGHIRNNLLGDSVAEILKANGNKVIKANLINNRGIHICKSMLAWQRWGNGETPENSGIKGDHLIGKYYVLFETKYRKQIKALIESGLEEKDAKKEAALIREAQEMLVKWEANDPEIYALWEKLNSWVYAGFDETYAKLGIKFDKLYYEHETFTLGKEKALDGLAKGVLFQKEDSSVWIDLKDDGLDEKLLIRSDGTTVYMTQDIGTAITRYNECHLHNLIYVVAHEQDYHFQVLFKVLDKLGYNWAKNLYHLSYGMVELPEGKMKSREGKVVDADDLIEEMVNTSRELSKELGKLEGVEESEAEKVYYTIAMGALKYFILKVDPHRNMLFNPKESIDFNGNTGPFIQYTYTRIQSVLRKATEQGIEIPKQIAKGLDLLPKERELIKLLLRFPEIVAEAGKEYSPALIANYEYELVKEFNQFYHDFSILREENLERRGFRLVLSEQIGQVIKSGFKLLGIDVPERM